MPEQRETARRHETLTALIEQSLWLVLVRSRHPRRRDRVVYAFRADSPDHARRIYRQPSRWDDVEAFAAVLFDQPHSQLVLPGPRRWEILRNLCRAA